MADRAAARVPGGGRSNGGRLPRQRLGKSVEGTCDNIAVPVCHDLSGWPENSLARGPDTSQRFCKIVIKLNADPSRNTYSVEQELSDPHRYRLGRSEEHTS